MMEEFDYLGAPYAPIDEHPEYSQPIEQDCSNGVIPQDATVIGTPTEDGKRRILVSEVTTINKPFFDRNKAMMTRYINTQLQNGNMRRIVPFPFTTKRINWLQRDYKYVSFWKVDRTHFIADVEVHLNLDTKEGVKEWVGIMVLFGDIEKNCVCTIEDLVDKADFEKRELVALSCFLIPIYSNKQMDKEMERLWRRYHPEALTDPSVRSAYELAKRMGLTIIRLPVYNHNATPSILFFVEDTILVKEAKSNSKEEPQEVRVPANTIVVNTNHRFSDYSEYYIYHECVHYEEHYMFFKLQEMHTNDIMRMKTKVQIVEADLLTDEEIADILPVAQDLAKWVEDLLAYATAQAEKGKTWPGYKLVASVTKRKYTNDADVIRACTEAGFTNIYKTTLLGISDLEKAIGKKAFKDVVSPYVFKPEGKPELVPLSDRRKPISSAEADFAE